MRSALAFLIVCVGPLLAQRPQPPAEYQGAMQQGVRALVTQRYAAAVSAFQRAVDLAPTAVNPRLNLATALMRQYDPTSTTAENLAVANRCYAEFAHVLRLDPNNWTAPVSIGVLLMGEASGAANQQSRRRLLEESREWYRQAVAIDSQSRQFWTWMVRDAWSRWYPDYQGPFFK